MYTTYYMYVTKYVTSPVWICVTVKYYDELLRKSKNRSLCSKNFYMVAQNMKKMSKQLVNTLQQLLARRRSVMYAMKTLWERRVDAVGTL